MVGKCIKNQKYKEPDTNAAESIRFLQLDFEQCDDEVPVLGIESCFSVCEACNLVIILTKLYWFMLSLWAFSWPFILSEHISSRMTQSPNPVWVQVIFILWFPHSQLVYSLLSRGSIIVKVRSWQHLAGTSKHNTAKFPDYLVLNLPLLWIIPSYRWGPASRWHV